MFRKALAGCRDQFGDSHPQTLTWISDLASSLRDQGKCSEAESLFREALTGRRQLEDDTKTLDVIRDLACLLRVQAECAKANSCFLAGRRALDYNPKTREAISASLLRDQAKFTEAKSLFQEALAGRKRLGDDLDAIRDLASLPQDHAAEEPCSSRGTGWTQATPRLL